jgi:hypothetical protein
VGTPAWAIIDAPSGSEERRRLARFSSHLVRTTPIAAQSRLEVVPFHEARYEEASDRSLSCSLAGPTAILPLGWLAPLLRDLFRFEDQAFEVFGFGQIEDDGMVGGGTAALEEAHAARGIGGG